jgi:hypothetical protein
MRETTALLLLYVLRRRQGQLDLSLYIFRHGKAIPAQAWTGTESSRRSRLPDFEKNGT